MTDTDWDWTDHIPSGGEGMDGYGYVSCACGWDSETGRDDWVTHIRRMGADSIDAAWAEAEAALPEGCTLKLEHDPSITDYPTSADVTEYSVHVDSESPAAALRALAVKLRERA
jgi:hypothetical protein